jgi:hypothetical protein
MSELPTFDSEFSDRVLELGREGLSRAEIAAALGASRVQLDAWAKEHPAFTIALERADTLAEAWWWARPREALTKGESFRASIWARAMAQRYPRAAAPASRTKEKPAAPRVRFEIPKNGREAKRPRR